ncbi:MAG TPA: MOSC domain-containing protein [Acidimicrobiia bacterium]|nr:MOSC domain-containing protein [Acidimicrobiia bacterium]
MTPTGTVEAIFVAARGGAPMQPVERIEVDHAGILGDRYRERTGHWTAVDECQVTLIAGEALDEIEATTGIRVGEGQHRRNIVMRGVVLRDLAGTRFSLGSAVFEYDRPRPPCRYIESITEPGMTRALAARRGGICVRVVEPGAVEVGARLEVVGEAERGPSILRRILR